MGAGGLRLKRFSRNGCLNESNSSLSANARHDMPGRLNSFIAQLNLFCRFDIPAIKR